MTEGIKVVTVTDQPGEPASPAIIAAAGAPGKPSASLSTERKKEQSDSPFSDAVIDVYDGPLDWLLALIRKQDIDIYDIPIARITAQYLAYVEKIRELDVNVAPDFIYSARCFINIKLTL